MVHLIRNRPAYKAQFQHFALILMACQLSCTYRFSNSFQRGKSNVRSICVEGIYSTAREVVPYQILWDAIQKRIALDGTFFVDDCDHAEAIVVGRLVNATAVASGDLTKLDAVKKDKTLEDPITAVQSDFRKLEVGSEIKRSTALTYNLKVDVLDLRTREVIFSKVYSRSETFLTHLNSDKITKNHEFPILEESIKTHTNSIGIDFASRLVGDLRSSLLR